jgi:hypothetical protein
MISSALFGPVYHPEKTVHFDSSNPACGLSRGYWNEKVTCT